MNETKAEVGVHAAPMGEDGRALHDSRVPAKQTVKRRERRAPTFYARAGTDGCRRRTPHTRRAFAKHGLASLRRVHEKRLQTRRFGRRCLREGEAFSGRWWRIEKFSPLWPSPLHPSGWAATTSVCSRCRGVASSPQRGLGRRARPLDDGARFTSPSGSFPRGQRCSPRCPCRRRSSPSAARRFWAHRLARRASRPSPCRA